MKSKKKIIIFIAAVILTALILVLVCRQKSNTAYDSGSENLPVLVIGSDTYEPYNYFDSSGSTVGIDVDIAKEACKRIGYRPVFKHIQWDEKDELLASGEIDCIWGSFSMNGRENDYNWAGPYLFGNQSVMVRASSKIYTLSDLADKNISVQVTSKPEQIFLNSELNERIPKVKKVYCFSELSEAFAALMKGYTDACAGHETALKAISAQSGTAYRILPEPIMTSEIGVAFLKGKDSDAPKKLEKAFSDMKKDGAISKILEQYGIYSEKMIGGGGN